MTIRTIRSLMVGNVLLPEHVLHAKAMREEKGLPSHMMKKKLAKTEQKKGGRDQSQSARESERQSALRSKRQAARKNQLGAADEGGQKSIERPNMFNKQPKNEDRDPNNSGEHGIAVTKNCCGEGSEQNDCCTESDTKHSSAKRESARGVGLRENENVSRSSTYIVSRNGEIVDVYGCWPWITRCYFVLLVLILLTLLCHKHVECLAKSRDFCCPLLVWEFICNGVLWISEFFFIRNAMNPWIDEFNVAYDVRDAHCLFRYFSRCFRPHQKYIHWSNYHMMEIATFHNCFFSITACFAVVNYDNKRNDGEKMSTPPPKYGFLCCHVIVVIVQWAASGVTLWRWPIWKPKYDPMGWLQTSTVDADTKDSMAASKANGEREGELSPRSMV